MQVIKREPMRGHHATIDITNEWGSSGITIEYVKSRDVFYISGWYDLMVGIEGAEISRSELFSLLGVHQ